MGRLKPNKVKIWTNLTVGRITVTGMYKGYTKVLEDFSSLEQAYRYVEDLGFKRNEVDVE